MTLPTIDEPGRVASGALAVLVHLMFFGLLVFGISWQKKIAGPIVVELWLTGSRAPGQCRHQSCATTL